MFTRLDWFTREMMKRNVTQEWSIIKASVGLSSKVVFLSIFGRKLPSNDALESIRPFKKMKRRMSLVFCGTCTFLSLMTYELICCI